MSPSSAADRRQDEVARARNGLYRAEPPYRPTPSGRPGPPPRGWRSFVSRYGWRAYALPILAFVTVAALVTSGSASRGNSAAHGRAAPPVASPSFTLKNDAAAGRVNDSVLKAAALPAGPDYTMKGAGTFKVLKGTSPKVGTGRLYRYSIEVENGISNVDLTEYQDLVVATLSDRRSWSGHGVALQRVDSGPIDFRISLTSSLTVRTFCGYEIPVETSCYAPAGDATPVSRVVFNVSRWVRGSAAYVGDLAAYRIYMINHEDGHALGHKHAHQCLAHGLAPVMMQQTFGLRSTATGQMCAANPWPYPDGVTDAPGAEQPDTAANTEYGHGD